MANVGNHQLKVLNLFNKGEENVVDKHLIHDTGFCEVINVDTSESVIRPARKPKYIMSVGGSHYIQETIKGKQRGITFDEPMNYVQFADTIYAVPRAGGNVYTAIVNANTVKVKSLFYNVERIHLEPTYKRTYPNPFEKLYTINIPYNKPFNINRSQNYLDLKTEQSAIYTKWIEPRWIPEELDYDSVLTAVKATRDKQATLYENLANEIDKGSFPTLFDRAKADIATIPDPLKYFPKHSTTDKAIFGFTGNTTTNADPNWGCAEFDLSNDYIVPAILSLVLVKDYFLDLLNWLQNRTYLNHITFIMWLKDCKPADTEVVGILANYLSGEMSNVTTPHFKHIEDLYTALIDTAPKYITDLTLPTAIDKALNNQAYRRKVYYWYIRNATTLPNSIGTVPTKQARWLLYLFGMFMKHPSHYNYITDLTKDTNFVRVFKEDSTTVGNLTKEVHTITDLDNYSITLRQALNRLASDYNYYKAYAEALRKLDFDSIFNDELHQYLVSIKNTDTNVTFHKYLDDRWIYNTPNGELTLSFSITQEGAYELTVSKRTFTDKAFRAMYKDTFTISAGNNSILTKVYTTDTMKTASWYNTVTIATPTAELSSKDFNLLQVYNGSMFIAHTGSQDMWFSEPNQPNFIKATGHLKVSQPIVAMQQAGAGLFIFTEDDALYLLTGYVNDGGGNNTLSLKRIANGVRPLSPKAVTAIDNLLIWLSTDGIHTTSGYGSSYGTRDIWRPSDKWGNVIDSIVFEGEAYFLYDTGLLLKYNYSKQRLLKFNIGEQNENLNNLTLSSFIGRLFFVGVFISPENHSKTQALQELFKSDKLLTYTAELKHFAGYSYDTRLRFTNVVVAHSEECYKEGSVAKGTETTFQIFVDNRLVASRLLKGTNSTRINLPQGNNTGQSIHYVVKGNLKIKSIRLRYSTHNYED